MKRDALAFLRLLPAGAADIGAAVTRDELRAAGLGDWSMTDLGHDDLSDVPDLFGGPDLFGDAFDELIPMEDRPTDPGLPVVELRLRKGR